ncbi:cellulose synthase regulator protein, partial [Pseudomonas syringae pv. actinidiae ICMP 18807]
TFLTGFESPLHKGRSVVLISSGQPGGMNDVARALSNSDKVQGSLVVVRGDSVEALVAEQNYYVGDLQRAVVIVGSRRGCGAGHRGGLPDPAFACQTPSGA